MIDTLRTAWDMAVFLAQSPIIVGVLLILVVALFVLEPRAQRRDDDRAPF